VTNGCVRDADEVRDIGISTYASGLCVSHAYVRLTAVDVPVVVGGLHIQSGDLLHGDPHGLLSIPLEAADKLPGLADEIRATEQASVGWAKSPEFSVPALLARKPPQH
jgi:regulator of RNase E activity RraA